MIDSLLSVIAPHPCFGCGKLGLAICDNCKYDIELEPYSRCVACQRLTRKNGSCGLCKLPYSRSWCVGERRDVLHRLIDGYKFERMRAVHRQLADLLESAVPELPASTVVVPIPTVPSHVRQRGYDHTLLIARRFAKLKGVSLSPSILRRKTNSVQRLAVSRKEREVQARRAFMINETLDSSKTYLLIDDVITSGATLRYAAKALREAGAGDVWVAVIARQVSTQ